jgi:Ca-activated chloride channel family protein
MGRGTSRVVRQDEPTQEVAEKFFRQINNPVLTNIQVKWEGEGSAPEIYPSKAPDLFAEQPLVLFGKKGDRVNGKVKITGIAAGGERYEQTLDINFGGENSNLGIAQLWGRARIKDLMNQMFGGEVKSLVDAVTQTALNYRLLSQYTAFVAVSEEVRVTPEGEKVTVQVPVLIPEGVSYDATVDGTPKTSALSSVNAPAPLPVAPSFNTSGRLQGAVIYSGKDQLQPRLRGNANASMEDAKVAKQVPSAQIQVVSITGLTGLDVVTSQQLITQQLSSINVPTGVNGVIILEIPIQNGRLTRFVLDDVASSIKDQNLIESIKRSLQNVVLSSSAQGTMRLTLKVNR